MSRRCDHLVVSGAAIENVVVAGGGHIIIAGLTTKSVEIAADPDPVVAVTPN